MADAKKFFNDYFNIKKMMEEKREYKEQMKRMKALPKDYQYVFEKIQTYMWSHVSGAGYDMMELQYRLIDLFEEGASEGKDVLQITGDDVAAFADDLLKSTKTSTKDAGEKLNEEIQKKLSH